MKITIHEDPSITETEILIKCAQMTDELRDMIAGMGLVGHTFAGERQGETFFIPIKDIFYFESVDGEIFFYTEKQTYKSTAKLYQIEQSLQNLKFARISKTVIASLSKMRSIKNSENSRLIATLTNDEKLLVSRQYVSEIKKKLGV
ncbi:MAG: LytTR family transcriptional regulator [Ruminococcaceae bacterium]|nr:LytTR family transcriptional regulator [Oscillospiraceae bacterium]